MSPIKPPAGKRDGEAPAPQNAQRLRLILVGLGAVIAVVLGVLAFMPDPRLAPSPASSSPAPVAGVGGPFTMLDVDGRVVDQRVLEGKWSAVFFGYTYCPDICPATLTALGSAKKELGDKAADLQAVFVSVDPERDTPAQLKSYLESPVFPRPLIGLTGSPEQLAAMAKAYRVYYARSGEGPDYLMDHASALYLMNPQGQFVRLVRTDASPSDMARQIAAAMGRS